VSLSIDSLQQRFLKSRQPALLELGPRIEGRNPIDLALSPNAMALHNTSCNFLHKLAIASVRLWTLLIFDPHCFGLKQLDR
jgi:hypothetical protein